MSTNRLELVAVDTWRQLLAAGEFKQRQVADQMVRMALAGCRLPADLTGNVYRAVDGQELGDTEMRKWLKQMADQETAAELDAEELDDDTVAADVHWRAARVYEVAYWALDADPAEAAGEATYETAQLLNEDDVLTAVRRIIETPRH